MNNNEAEIKILNIPIGINENGTRLETDSIGTVEVPANKYWGSETQRSLLHFSIGNDKMPIELYHAYGYVKKAAAIVNANIGSLPKWKADLIAKVADEIIEGKLDDNFPLYVWQTGSGTQSNMNVNEVISNRAIQLVGGKLGSKIPVHPNDDVNMSQSSNDSFPTAMHIATIKEITGSLIPHAEQLQQAIDAKSKQWHDIVKIGRTHLQDAVPLTVGQEWSGYASQLFDAIDKLKKSLACLYPVAMGGTAVGTGLNAPKNFAEEAATQLALLTGYPITTAANKFAALGGLDAMVSVSANIRGLAVSLMKIANDIRWLASGPRCGIGELQLPVTEPGSSIMPGKINPTLCEAMVMVCIQVMAEDSSVAVAGSQGNFELNAMRPVIINNVLHSARILGDVCHQFKKYCIDGIELNRDTINNYVNNSLMLVTALSPMIGYDKASVIAQKANREGITLREAALATGFLDESSFDKIVDPLKMTGLV